MRKYEIKIVPNVDVEGKTYWKAFFPAIEGCIGGGNTAEEAVNEAQENLEVYLEYLQEEKRSLPEEYVENSYSGKIALRIAKSTHQKIAQLSDSEGISINSIINNAIENYLGSKKYENAIDKKIEEIFENTNKSMQLQQLNFAISTQLCQTWNEKGFWRE